MPDFQPLLKPKQLIKTDCHSCSCHGFSYVIGVIFGHELMFLILFTTLTVAMLVLGVGNRDACGIHVSGAEFTMNII